jgi:hypothetical protein
VIFLRIKADGLKWLGARGPFVEEQFGPNRVAAIDREIDTVVLDGRTRWITETRQGPIMAGGVGHLGCAAKVP